MGSTAKGGLAAFQLIQCLPGNHFASQDVLNETPRTSARMEGRRRGGEIEIVFGFIQG